MSRRRTAAEITAPLETCRRPPVDSRLGSYSVVAPLARGGTSGVYLAEHTVTGERVALKVLDPFFHDNADLTRRLLDERAISERVRHASLLDIRVADRSASGVPYLVMEYLDGESLAALVDRGDLDLDAIVATAAQVAAALDALHGAGFVHCDVKPSNVFVLYRIGLRGWPQVKVIDYGVARRLGEARTDSAIAGTPAYMAPEQWRGEPTPASDVYSLGCMLYELVTGEPLFTGPLPRLMQAHCEQLPVRPSEHRADLPLELERLIVRMLAKDPALRPSMVEVEAELLRLLRVSTAAAAAVFADASGPIAVAAAG